MRIPRLYVEAALAVGGTVTMTSASAHYLVHVLRCRPGNRVTLFNGKGGEYTGEVTRIARDRVDVRLDAFCPDDRESPLTIKLGLGVIKRDAMDAALQKATELGVTEITPVVATFTDVPARAVAGRASHWLQVVRSACEQCGRNRPPAVHDATPLTAWLSTVTADAKWVAHPGAPGGFVDPLPGLRSIALLTGPEGGFNDAEVANCLAAGFTPVSLGPRILRADTAPLALLALIQAKWGDLLAPQPAPSTSSAVDST